MRYSVIAKVQANDGEPVNMKWASNTDELGVIQSVTQLLSHNNEWDPWTARTLSITIERLDA